MERRGRKDICTGTFTEREDNCMWEGDGSVQRWTTDGKMIEGVWTGHRDRVRSLSWSPSGSQIASGSYDGTILIRNAESGKVEVGRINAGHRYVLALEYSPSGDQIASCGDIAIYIWNTKTGERIVGPIKDLGDSVTSLVWSSDGTKLYSASDKFARVFDSKSGKLLHRFEHNKLLWSVALSPKNNLLACNPLLRHILRKWEIVAYGGSDNKLTLWVLKDISPQLSAPIPPQQSDKQNTEHETRPNSPLSSCPDADATGGGGFIEETHDDPYDNFFQCSQQSLPSPSPGFHFPSLFSARRLLNVIFRRRPPPDESIPQERSKRGFFSRRARSNSSLEPTPIKQNQPVPEKKVGEGEGEQSENAHDHGSAQDLLSVTKYKCKQREDPPVNAQSPPSYGRAFPAHPDSKDSQSPWERLMQARGKRLTSGFLHSSTLHANAPQPIPRSSWQWNSSPLLVGSSRHHVDVAACRDEDRYGITPETDEEAAAAMRRTDDDVASTSIQPVVAQVSQRRPTPTQALTSGPEEITYEGLDQSTRLRERAMVRDRHNLIVTRAPSYKKRTSQQTLSSRRPLKKLQFTEHEKAVWSFVFLHDNIYMVSGSEDGTMRKWNCNTGLVVGEPWKSEGGKIYALALSPDGKVIACGRRNGSIQRWTINGKMIEGVWTSHSNRVQSLSWSPDGKQLASGSYDETILIRNAESGKVEVGPIKAEQHWVWSLAYSPSGDRIASGGYKTISIWDTKTCKRVVGPIEDLWNNVTSVVWSSDGTKLYSASDKIARAFDSKSGQLLHHFEHDDILWSVALSPKHNILACVGVKGVVRLWNTESHQPLDLPLHQDHKTIYHVTFSRDGKM
ncbi:WD40-repeat-containing domain protein [Suillus spraguei]|nr:WD40-repeat-containing domain protein [Suillus spraguei]